MKRLRSSDDLNSYEKNGGKESNQNLNRSLSSHRSSSGNGGFYYKPSSTSDNIARSKSNLISPSSSRYDRDRSGADEDSGRERDRDGMRIVRKRSDHDFESFDRRKLGFDRYRDGASGSSNALPRSESFCGPRRDFPKGFRSERDRNRRDGGSGSSWRRLGVDENRFGSKVQLRELRDPKSPTWTRDSIGAGRVGGEGREREELRNSRSPTWPRDSLGSARVGGEGREREELRDARLPMWSRDSFGAARMGEGKDREELRDSKSPTWSRDSWKAAKMGGEGREREELRDSKSPTWSRDSFGTARVGGEGREELRDAKLPAWSRDSLGAARVGGEEREREELRVAKSPTWSRDSLGAARVGEVGREREELRDAKSPTWSRGSLGAARVGGEGREREVLRDAKSPTWSRDSLGAARVGGEGREREELRDAKSPTWSRASLGAVRVGGEGREREELRRSPKSISKSMSPTSSRDSESEQSKSVVGGGEVKKDDDMADGGRSSSEMEEGELEPELEAGNKESVSHEEKECSNKEIETEGACGKTNSDDGIKLSENEGNKEMDVDESQNSERSQHSGVGGNKDGVEVVDDNGGGKEGECGKDDGKFKERTEDKVFKSSLHLEENSSKDKVINRSLHLEENSSEDKVLESSLHSEENNKNDKGIAIGMKVDASKVEEREKEITGDRIGAKESMDAAEEGVGLSFKDKGKRVAIPFMEVAVSADNGQWNERESLNGDDHIEGPSTRGFDLFSCSPVRKVEKVGQSGIDKLKEENLKLEPLDLSLSLPSVLRPIGATDANATPGSPSHGKSAQSINTFCTNSDGFTQSMSFSGSQSFYHNPSCSLTQNSVDYEQSVHSRPIFQGVDFVSQESSQVQNESRHKDRPMYQRILMNGNGSVHQSQALQGIANGRVVHGQHSRSAEGSSRKTDGLDRQLSFHKHTDGRAPLQSATSLDVSSNYSFEKKRSIREEHGGGLFRSSSQKEKQLLIGGADFVETIICRIISDPIHVMARKFHEMTGQSIACLKESIHEVMLNADKRGQLSATQSALQNMSELSMEMLLKSHRAQLEILVALKTGLPEYLQPDKSIPSSDLAEIFLNLKCRNLACRSPLPVDECDCKVCSRKKGFCSACMCLVCSKFDTASNTCSWVGCDVCLHWCHADCGLRESYIRNGHSATAAQGSSEMQFHCVACDHPSEMFGFVKEVFQNFANEWTPEIFSRELEYVKRIFSGSKDVRGKRLHEFANQMLPRLARKSDLREVYSHVMAFLTESDSSKLGNTCAVPGKEQGKQSDGNAGPSNEPWLKSSHSDKATPKLESSSSLLPSSFHLDRTDRRSLESDSHRDTQKQQTLMPELESFIRIKQEEAKMYQARADDARREAEGLKRIATSKSEKIEEEYMMRITKLRLLESEETRQKKFEEFQALEKSHREYFSMKMRMESDIKDLLLKMEATRRNLS